MIGRICGASGGRRRQRTRFGFAMASTLLVLVCSGQHVVRARRVAEGLNALCERRRGQWTAGRGKLIVRGGVRCRPGLVKHCCFGAHASQTRLAGAQGSEAVGGGDHCFAVYKTREGCCAQQSCQNPISIRSAEVSGQRAADRQLLRKSVRWAAVQVTGRCRRQKGWCINSGQFPFHGVDELGLFLQRTASRAPSTPQDRLQNAASRETEGCASKLQDETEATHPGRRLVSRGRQLYFCAR